MSSQGLCQAIAENAHAFAGNQIANAYEAVFSDYFDFYLPDQIGNRGIQ